MKSKNNSAIKWEGIFAALWTPTDKSGKLLKAKLKANIAFVRQSPVTGVLALASTGEFIYLDVETRKQLLAEVIQCAAPLPVIANISDIRPQAVIELARFAQKSGAHAVTLLPPYFYHFSQNELVEWFVRAGEATDLPLFLYNFPELTGNKIALDTIGEICRRTRVAGIKQSGPEFDYLKPLVELGREKNFVVFTGADIFLANLLEMGGAGCIGGFANVVSDVMTEIFLAARAGDPSRLRIADARLQTVWSTTEDLPFPLSVAAAMEARGLAVGEPKGILSGATKALYKKRVGQLRALFAAWK
jgi:dihydrodipicolinate synthase/N-acetylneuraminate lyase